VVGIDILAPALELAWANVSAANLHGRIELRQQDALALANTAEFSAAWLPLPFLPAAIVPAVLEAVRGSLRPGGCLVAGTFAPGGPGRLAELLMNLRTLRSGGRPWVADDLLPALTSAGYVDPIAVPRTWPAPVHLFLGRRP
jgi:SAM-dependent methyltransferase